LSSQTVRAVDVGEARRFWVAFRVVEAVVADGLGGEVITSRSLEGVTRDHAEAFRERL